jgi:hypothetical protein
LREAHWHSIGAKHLPVYLDEFESRFNRRNSAKLFEDTVTPLATADPLTFAKVTATKQRESVQC